MDIRKLNDHIANIGEELTRAAELIRHDIDAANMTDCARTASCLPTMANIERYANLVHARLHANFMNDGRSTQPPTTEEMKLHEWFESTLGKAREPQWAAQEPENVQTVRDEPIAKLDVYVFRLHFGNGVIDVVRMPGLTNVHAAQDVKAIHSAANRIEFIGVEK